MRIWHEQLIPRLCRQHLLAMWREGLGAYSIITNDKKGYRNHPALKEFAACPNLLAQRLQAVRAEMLRRGYHPKEAPIPIQAELEIEQERYHEWQSLEEQVERLKAKGCACQV
jgi:hypothetical protein